MLEVKIGISPRPICRKTVAVCPQFNLMFTAEFGGFKMETFKNGKLDKTTVTKEAITEASFKKIIGEIVFEKYENNAVKFN